MFNSHNRLSFRLISFVYIILLAIVMSGCRGPLAAAVAVADANQKPSVAEFRSKQSIDKIFTAAVKSLSTMGQVTTTDRSSGIVQGKKGSWIISASISSDKSDSIVAVTARFVPGNQMDFNSREGLTTEFVAGVENALGEKLESIDRKI